MAPTGFAKYVQRAFLVPWNLLGVGTGVAAGIVAGFPGVVVPLVLAAEVLYLSLLAANRRFQGAVDAEEHAAAKQGSAAALGVKLDEMLAALGAEDRSRFDRLRGQCAELREIAGKVKADAGADAGEVDAWHSSGVNRLLWIYLKLLYSKNAIERFFAAIDRKEIEDGLVRVGERIAGLPAVETENENDRRRRASLEDQRRTLELRLRNYDKARENHAFIEDELDRLSTKIASLAELTINREDPNFITSEVDSVSASVENSEKAMGELSFLTGLTAHDDAPPELIGNRASATSSE